MRRVSTAMVMANGLATIYRRWGSGRTVLLLGINRDARDALAVALSPSFRVIVPNVPLLVSDLGAAAWLGGVYDGLGIDAATIVTTPVLADVAFQLRQDAPDRVNAVLITDFARPDIAWLRQAIERAFS